MEKCTFRTIEVKGDALVILDQTLLPLEEKYIEAYTVEDVYDCIKRLAVRGATAIGVAGGYGMWLAAKEVLQGLSDDKPLSPEELYVVSIALDERAAYLNSSRPTAVNLSYAIGRVMDEYRRLEESLSSDKEGIARQYVTASDIINTIFDAADRIRIEDDECCMSKGEYGLTLLKPGMRILTHCNAGGLATTGFGGAFAPIYMGQERGYGFKVYCDETRPLLQGARLSSWELSKMGVDTTVIYDNMAATLMSQGMIDCVIVGCDRMAANGDGANKIGTLGLSVLAKEYGIPFYMNVPTSTLDMNTKTGADIVIEQRAPEEVTELWYEKRMVPEGVKVFNPAFDVTDHSLITAVITEKGVLYPPYEESIRAVMEGDR